MPDIIANNISYHDEVAKDYNSVMGGHEANEWIRLRVRERFCHLVPAGRVLDFGGGTGLDLEWLTDAGYKVVFCEPSVGMRKEAMEYEERVLSSGAVHFLEGQATDFSTWEQIAPWEGEVDAALSDFGALNYIPDIAMFFRHMAGRVRAGGHILLLVLRLPFAKRWKWHRKNAIVNLLTGSVFRMYIPYKEHRQMIFVHTEKQIMKAAAPWFRHAGMELLAEHDFILIHLVRNETTD